MKKLILFTLIQLSTSANIECLPKSFNIGEIIESKKCQKVIESSLDFKTADICVGELRVKKKKAYFVDGKLSYIDKESKKRKEVLFATYTANSNNFTESENQIMYDSLSMNPETTHLHRHIFTYTYTDDFKSLFILKREGFFRTKEKYRAVISCN